MFIDLHCFLSKAMWSMGLLSLLFTKQRDEIEKVSRWGICLLKTMKEFLICFVIKDFPCRKISLDGVKFYPNAF